MLQNHGAWNIYRKAAMMPYWGLGFEIEDALRRAKMSVVVSMSLLDLEVTRYPERVNRI